MSHYPFKSHRYKLFTYMLMLYRTYRLVRKTEWLIKDSYLHGNLERHSPHWRHLPSVSELKSRFRIYSRDPEKRDYIFTRTLEWAAAKEYITISVRGSSDEGKYVDVQRDNGERLLLGTLWWGYIKELIRTDNFLATLIIALTAVIIALLAYFKGE